jgi:hypothetical protein
VIHPARNAGHKEMFFQCYFGRNLTKSGKMCMSCRFGTTKIFCEKQEGKDKIKKGTLSVENRIFP